MTKSEPSSADDGPGSAVISIIRWLILGGILTGAYWYGDQIGLVPHERESTITAETNWLVGESKACTSFPLSDDSAAATKKEPGDAVSALSCDNGPRHDIKVTFFGRTDQPEYSLVEWKCKRTSDGFTCYELSGVHR